MAGALTFINQYGSRKCKTLININEDARINMKEGGRQGAGFLTPRVRGTFGKGDFRAKPA
jgi:hypothetical protein